MRTVGDDETASSEVVIVLPGASAPPDATDVTIITTEPEQAADGPHPAAVPPTRLQRWRRSPRFWIIVGATVAVALLAALITQGVTIGSLQHQLFESRSSDLDARTQLLGARIRFNRDVE